ANTDCYADSDTYTDSHTDSYSHSNAYRDGYGHANTDANADRYSDSASSDANAYFKAHSNAQAAANVAAAAVGRTKEKRGAVSLGNAVALPQTEIRSVFRDGGLEAAAACLCLPRGRRAKAWCQFLKFVSKKSKNDLDTFPRVQLRTVLHSWNQGKL